MKSLKEYLQIFAPLLNELMDTNIVIGGIHALRAHGLTTRDTGDLDVIIYNPTERQLEIIRNRTWEMEVVEREDEYEERPGEKRRSFKFGVDRQTVIDFLMEYDTPMPENLLLVPGQGGDLYFVQSIEEVIKAKARYGREKDLEDFKQLKEKNFNP